MNFDRRVERQFSGRRAENAEPAPLRRVIRNGQAKDHRLAGGQDGAVSIGQGDHAVDQLAVAAMLDAREVREHAARVGRIVGQCDSVDRPPVQQNGERRGPRAGQVGLGIILPVDPLGPVDAFALGLGARLEQEVNRLGMGFDDRRRKCNAVLEVTLAIAVDLARRCLRRLGPLLAREVARLRIEWSRRDRSAARFGAAADRA